MCLKNNVRFFGSKTALKVSKNFLVEILVYVFQMVLNGKDKFGKQFNLRLF